MAAELGSVASPTQGRRFSRPGRGKNGRNVQLDRLGDVLTAPTYRAQKCFAPSDSLSLPDNVLAPVQKKRRNNKKATMPPPAASQPRHQLLSQIDPRLGFYTPHPSSTPSSPLLRCEPPARLSPESPHSTHSSHQPPAIVPSPRPLLPLQPPAAMPSPQPLPSPQLSAVMPSHPQLANAPASSNSGLHPDFDESEVDESDADDIHEPDIDERSDDEDDRTAHELLRAAPTSMQDLGDPQPALRAMPATTRGLADPQPVLPYDHQGFAELGNDNSVLHAHYARNRMPKAPKPSNICRIPSAQPLSRAPPPPPPSDPENVSRTLNSYPSEWQEVIGHAKQTFKAFIAGKSGFPDPIEGINEARECLDDALAVHLEGGRVVEPDHHINKDMIMLVYAESWLLRSQLKADIRTQVRNLKSLFPDWFTGTAQNERRVSFNRDEAEAKLYHRRMRERGELILG